MVVAALTGLLAGLSLIVAIGAQNALVLRQGLRREHVGVVVALCTASDAVLIAAGLLGVGALVEAAPVALQAVRWLGVAFLASYGVVSLRRAAVVTERLEVTASGVASRRSVVARTLALTWLNPHVYLDTVLLLGSLAAQQASRAAFGVGAATASLLWFVGLGYAARRLAPLFARPGAWRVLDVVVGLVMLAIAARLALEPL